MKGTPAAAALLLLASAPLLASGRAFQVRTYPNLRSADSVGDRDAATGEFWFAQGEYDNPTGGQIPKAVRLAPDGTRTTWQINAAAETFAPIALRRGGGKVWILVPLFAQGAGALYSLDPATNAVTRTALPFPAVSLALDPASGTPWVTGTGMVARLSGGTLTTWSVPHLAGGSSRIDASRRLWLETDDGSIASFAIDTGAVETWADAGTSLRALDVDTSGRVWGIAADQTELVCLEPGSRLETSFPLVFTAQNWAAVGAGSGGLVPVVSAYGPHVLFQDPAAMPDGVAATLAAPTPTTIGGVDATPPATSTAVVPESAVEPYFDRVVYAEADLGRTLFQLDGIGFSSLLWSDGSQLLAGSGPLLWWRPVTGSFATQAVLPAVVEVRPDDPTNNFLTELTIANQDADAIVQLTFQTADATYTVTAGIPPGRTVTFPRAVQALRDLGATSIPAGASGTLTATFSNGGGRMWARVFTQFGNSAVFPQGSTTGLGFSSVDPARKLSTYRTTLNGLKNTPEFRTNIAVANLCGALAPAVCPTLSITATFLDDATGSTVGTADLEVPPGQLRQLNAPLAGFGATGETFSVQLQPYNAGAAGYDAYATVISNAVQDAAFVRASSIVNSSAPTLPVVVDSGGAGGSRFVSEASVTSTDVVPSTADVTFTSAISGNVVSEVLDLLPGRGVRWPNAVDHFRQIAPDKVAANDYGPVRIAFRQYASGFASSRTTAANGTGLAFTAVDPFIERATRVKRILGFRQNGAFRTNLAVVHLGPTTGDPAAPITLRVTITDDQGNPVGAPLTTTLAPGRLYQWNQILQDTFGVQGEDFGATIERISGRDAFDAYITTIDDVTSDATFLRAE